MPFAKVLKSWLRNEGSEPEENSNSEQKGQLRLVFQGVVQSGMGMYSELSFPGPDEIARAPSDWPDPETMQPGSLNIAITEYPDNLENLTGVTNRITGLDNGHFQPEFSIPAASIGANALMPRNGGDPKRGIAQIWRCNVENQDTGEKFDAWVVRRIGSAYYNILELMADRKLRDTHNLEDGTPVTLTVFDGPK